MLKSSSPGTGRDCHSGCEVLCILNLPVHPTLLWTRASLFVSGPLTPRPEPAELRRITTLTCWQGLPSDSVRGGWLLSQFLSDQSLRTGSLGQLYMTLRLSTFSFQVDTWPLGASPKPNLPWPHQAFHAGIPPGLPHLLGSTCRRLGIPYHTS